jgi:Flp pilus assembly pilin Flp
MLDFIKTFRADEDGAVTVDWVVLTAAIVGLGIAVFAAINGELGSATASIAADLTNAGATVTLPGN